MKKITTLGLVVLFCTSGWGQNNIVDELKNLSDSSEYVKIIVEHAPLADTYSPEAIYYIGHAYFMTEDNDKALSMIDLSLEKDSINADSHYLKGVVLMFMERDEESINSLQTAIDLNPEKPKYYSALGDVLSSLQNYKDAIIAYKTANKKGEEEPERNLFMIAQAYSELSEKGEALRAYYEAKNHSDIEFSFYNSILFNIGTLESLAGNDQKAETVFLELVDLFPDDYHSYAKLIQIYNKTEEFDKIQQYKDLLYDAHKKNLLEETYLEDMFCIDQFRWKDKNIRAFERYETGISNRIYDKFRFYILDENDNTEYRIQTEYSPALKNNDTATYFLCAWKDGTHVNYGITFDEKVEYRKVKKAVLTILENKTK